MHDSQTVERPHASDYLDEDLPNDVFRELSLLFLVLADPLEQVAVVGILHHDAGNRYIFIFI